MSYESDKQLASIRTEVTALGATTRLGAIAGIDRGTININDTNATQTATATVGAVATGRSLLSNLGQRSASGNPGDIDNNALAGTLELTNSTTITWNIGSATAGAYNVTLSYELVEYSA